MKGLLQMHKDVAAFAQGYKAKGKKDKKDEEVLDEAKQHYPDLVETD